MRKDESARVIATLRALGLDGHLTFVDASDTFLHALEGVVEPERKRRIIGDTFVEQPLRDGGRDEPRGTRHALCSQDDKPGRGESNRYSHVFRSTAM